MYEVLHDQSGGVFFYPLEDEYRNRRHPRPRPRPRRPYQPRPVHYQSVAPPTPYQPMAPAPVQYAPMPYQPMPYQPMPYQPMPAGYPHPAPPSGLDMRAGLKALGALMPAFGHLVSAFKGAPDRPALTGQPDRDMAALAEYVADSFERDRSGAQTAGVLGTAGALLKILADL